MMPQPKAYPQQASASSRGLAAGARRYSNIAEQIAGELHGDVPGYLWVDAKARPPVIKAPRRMLPTVEDTWQALQDACNSDQSTSEELDRRRSEHQTMVAWTNARRQLEAAAAAINANIDPSVAFLEGTWVRVLWTMSADKWKTQTATGAATATMSGPRSCWESFRDT